MVPSLASDQVFYEDKTEKGSLKQVKIENQPKEFPLQVQALHTHDAFFHSLMVGSKFQVASDNCFQVFISGILV